MGYLREAARRALTRVRPPLQCSACGRAKGTETRFLSGPGVYLCEVCVRDAMAHGSGPVVAEGAAARCRFCGQRRPPVAFADAAPLAVCATCMRLMDTVLTEDDRRGRPVT
jgi:hypothetical protein